MSTMKILIAGGTGFLGRPLAAALAADGHDVVARGRAGVSAADVNGAGAIVNLAGEPIAGKRWTAAQKQRILDSRVLATRSLVTAIQGASAPPPVFVSGSAVGYYGPLGDTAVTEAAPAGSAFPAKPCGPWGGEALLASSDATR